MLLVAWFYIRTKYLLCEIFQSKIKIAFIEGMNLPLYPIVYVIFSAGYQNIVITIAFHIHFKYLFIRLDSNAIRY